MLSTAVADVWDVVTDTAASVGRVTSLFSCLSVGGWRHSFVHLARSLASRSPVPSVRHRRLPERAVFAGRPASLVVSLTPDT